MTAEALVWIYIASSRALLVVIVPERMCTEGCEPEIQAQQEELARSNTAEMEQLNGDLAEALQLLVEHKLGIQEALQDAHSHLQGVLQQVAAMALTA